MAIEKEVKPYEILVRFNPEGLQGVHLVEDTVVTEDGMVIAVAHGTAHAISREDAVAIINAAPLAPLTDE